MAIIGSSSSGASSINAYDALYLSLSDNPHMSLVENVFDGREFDCWKRSITVALLAKNKFGFIKGKSIVPSEESANYKNWLRCDTMIKSWILNSVSEDIAESVRSLNSAHEIWTTLEDRFGESNEAKLYRLRKDLDSLVQGRSDVAEYFTKMNKIWEELNLLRKFPRCPCGGSQMMSKFESDKRLIRFLTGLNFDYSRVREKVLRMKPLPSITEAYALVIEEETRRHLKFSDHAFGFGNNIQDFPVVPIPTERQFDGILSLLTQLIGRRSPDSQARSANLVGAGFCDREYRALEGGPADQKKIDTHIMIATFIATLVIPATYSIYGLYGSDQPHSQIQNLFFYGFTASDSLAMVFSLMSLLVYFSGPVLDRTSTRFLSWAHALTMTSLVLMDMAFCSISLALLPLTPGIIASAIMSTFVIFYFIFRYAF